MEKLAQLKSELSDEMKKPKNARNSGLIEDLRERISEEKKIMRVEFQNRQKEKHKEEVSAKLSLWKKKNDRYGKIREENKRRRLEAEKKIREKSQQKKKAK